MMLIAAVILAVYAWSYSIALLPGPFNVLTHLRGWVYARYGDTSWQAEGIGCPICVSFWLSWLAAAIVWAYDVAPFDALMYTMSSLGIWGAATFLYRLGREQ